MPQETKARPFDAEEIALGVVHEQLEGWIPSMASDDEICSALEKAFDYRGDVSLTLKDGARIDGYIFDRTGEGSDLSQRFVRLIGKDSDERKRIRYSDIARLEFTGRDTAAGKSFETWVRKYQEKKAAGEKNISIEPEKLD